MGTKEFLFSWTPNPTEFIRQNHGKYLTNSEYKSLLSCTSIAFDTNVDLFNNKIVSIKYSKMSTDYNNSYGSPDLDSLLVRKVEKILVENIGVTKIRQMNNKDIPREIRRYLITLDFNAKDRKKTKKLK